MASSSSSSPSTNSYTHDVFLSFRGEDTRIGFTGNLYSALCRRGVLTFIDDHGLRKGDEITPSLLKAIRDSRMAIIIFSKNYASSTFCLKELAEIMESQTVERGKHVWPIFYDVDPSDVRHQRGSFGSAFSKHEKGIYNKDGMQTVKKWRSALGQAANLSGWHFKQQGGEYEHLFIKRIVDEVSKKLNRPLLHVANYPVGLEAHMQNLQSLDAWFDNKVNMLGIYGIGGIGKSTIARTIYNSKVDQFEGSCFLANVREKSTGHGLVQIQEAMLSQLFDERNIKLEDVNHGISVLKQRLHGKKVLVVLDDVDEIKQLEAVAGRHDWFGFGSIIIITTRNKHLLDIHGVKSLYKVDKLNDAEALELFWWNAFKNTEVDASYTEIIKSTISYANGLPLALQTIGSNLFGKTVDEWKSALEAYERIPNKDIQETLRVSYDGLEENEKEIFLDIACFFHGCTLEYVTSMLHARGFQPKYGIRVLEEKSLIKIGFDGVVTMHDLIQCMGKEIVRQESTWPDKRNRLWFHEDIIHVLKKNSENYRIEAMMLDMPEDKIVYWNEEVIGKMNNLRLLIKKSGCCLRNPKHLPNSLRVLEWWGYPSASLPFDFLLENLFVLNLSHSCFQWDKPLEKSKYLSHLIFTGCECIRQVPDVSGSPNLTELCVDDCTNLIVIHDSVGFLHKLQRFSAKGCTKLKIIPRHIKLTSLEYLCLRDCSDLNIFPEIVGPMEKLKFVDLEGTAIENLPLSIQNLGGLQSLSLNRCKKLNTDALSNIFQMLPFVSPYLSQLSLDDSNLTIIPECIQQCSLLKILNVDNCKQLQEFRGLPQNIERVNASNCPSMNIHCSTSKMSLKRIFQPASTGERYFRLTGDRIPEWFDISNPGNSVGFWFRNGIPDITVAAVIGGEERSFIYFFTINYTFRHFGLMISSKSCYSPDEIIICNNFREILSSSSTLRLHDGWNYAEVLFYEDYVTIKSVRRSGIYINREYTSMENIRFTNPYHMKLTSDDSSFSNQLALPGNGLNDTPHIDHVQCNADSVESEKTIHDSTVRRKKPFVCSLWLLLTLAVVFCSLMWPLGFYRNFTPTSTYSRQDLAVLDHLKKSPRASFQAQAFAKKENIHTQGFILSRDKVSEAEQNLKRCFTDESFRYQVEQVQDDGEMEAFYASLDGGTRVPSCSRDESATTFLSEESKEALKIIQDFISNDASIFLHPEHCSVMQASLDFLSNLSQDDAISDEMMALILEASRKFAYWTNDYIEASMKIESISSELLKVDELEATLKDNKKQFREVVALENELLQKLSYMEERKKDLEEKINAIQVDISSCETRKNMARQRKKEIFAEGKILNLQKEESREKVLSLKQEQGVAKRTQAKISDEWSKLGEKFKKIIVE